MLILNLIAETSERRSSVYAVNTVTTLTVCHRIVQFIYDYTKQEVHVVWIGLRACGFNLQLEWVAPSDPSQVRYLADRSWCTVARPRYRGPLLQAGAVGGVERRVAAATPPGGLQDGGEAGQRGGPSVGRPQPPALPQQGEAADQSPGQFTSSPDSQHGSS